MINYGRVYGSTQPPELQFTATSVFVAKNITPYTIEEEYGTTGYEYDYFCYNKDEYIQLLAEKNQSFEEELHATKILLGVE